MGEPRLQEDPTPLHQEVRVGENDTRAFLIAGIFSVGSYFVAVGTLVWIFASSEPGFRHLAVPMLIACSSGMLGGVLYCLKAMIRHYSDLQHFQMRYIWWYSTYPLMGIVTGFLTSVIQILATQEDLDAVRLNPLVAVIPAFLAGYQSSKFIRKLSKSRD